MLIAVPLVALSMATADASSRSSTARPLPRGVTAVPFVAGLTPNDPPETVPYVRCQRVLPGGTKEVVFGYRHTGPSRVTKPSVEPIPGWRNPNQVVIGATAVENAGQVTQFKPGDRPATWSVQVRPGTKVRWELVVPSLSATGSPQWTVRADSTGAPHCERTVPARFAVVQDATGVVMGPVDIGGDGDGKVTSYAVRAGAPQVVVACSNGGVGRLDRALIGWREPAINVGPIPDGAVVERATYPGGDLVFTVPELSRPVLDVAEPAFVAPLADVIGVCRYPDGSEVRSEVFWADNPWAMWVFSLADGGTAVISQAVAPEALRFR